MSRVLWSIFAAMTAGLIAVFVDAVLANAAPPPAPADRPNVLYVFTDQQSAEAMSCVGNKDVKTPAMDGLAENGVVFSQAYCTYPLCSPSRSSMLTGLIPHATGVADNGREILPALRHRELGWALKDAGYETAYAGKGLLPTFSSLDSSHGCEVLCRPPAPPGPAAQSSPIQFPISDPQGGRQAIK